MSTFLRNRVPIASRTTRLASPLYVYWRFWACDIFYPQPDSEDEGGETDKLESSGRGGMTGLWGRMTLFMMSAALVWYPLAMRGSGHNPRDLARDWARRTRHGGKSIINLGRNTISNNNDARTCHTWPLCTRIGLRDQLREVGDEGISGGEGISRKGNADMIIP